MSECVLAQLSIYFGKHVSNVERKPMLGKPTGLSLTAKKFDSGPCMKAETDMNFFGRIFMDQSMVMNASPSSKFSIISAFVSSVQTVLIM